MQDGIAKVIELLGNEIAALEREVTLYKSLYEATEKQKIEFEKRLVSMAEAQNDED